MNLDSIILSIGDKGYQSRAVGSFVLHHAWLADDRKLKKNTDSKAVKQSPKTKFGPKFKISYLELFFWKYYFGHKTILYSSTRSTGHHQRCFLVFRFSSRKSQCQQKLTKKINHLTIQFVNFGDWIISARCLDLAKCFTIFYFNWNFLKFNYFSAFHL